jgi:hypothetical protein
MAWSKNPEKKPGTSSSIKIQSTFWGKAIFEGSIQAKKRGLSEQRNWLAGGRFGWALGQRTVYNQPHNGT